VIHQNELAFMIMNHGSSHNVSGLKMRFMFKIGTN